MSGCKMLQLHVSPIKSALEKVSTDIKLCLSKDKCSKEQLLKFHKKYNSLSINFHQILDELLPLC